MAKRRKKNRYYQKRVRRDAPLTKRNFVRLHNPSISSFANTLLSPRLLPSPRYTVRRGSVARPTRSYAPKALVARDQRIADLRRANVCVQRQDRKEVLHAIGKAGSRVKRPNYTPRSKVRC